MSFLETEWRKLAFINYKVDPNLLKKYIPAGTVLDLYNGDCFISLVGLMFYNTKIMGLKIPFHTQFEEVNLRFYVEHHEGIERKRGVVFIKEIVAKPALTLVANLAYSENYETMPMEHTLEIKEDTQVVEYKWKKDNFWNSMKVVTSTNTRKVEPKSETEFILENYWGYASVDAETTNQYQVKHPHWEVYNIKEHIVNVDFEAVYGEEFAFLNEAQPSSIILAEGSEVSVEDKVVLKFKVED